MKIKVEHEVPYDEGYESQCCYNDGTFMEGRTVCRYHAFRNSFHGRKAPAEYHKPKCTLFNEWLPGEYRKCGTCLAKCTENGGHNDAAYNA